MEFNDKVERFDNLIIGFSGGRDSSYGVLLIDQMFDKNVVAEKTTITRDTIQIEEKTGNIYESIVAVSKRSNQISVEIKEELTNE